MMGRKSRKEANKTETDRQIDTKSDTRRKKSRRTEKKRDIYT